DLFPGMHFTDRLMDRIDLRGMGRIVIDERKGLLSDLVGKPALHPLETAHGVTEHLGVTATVLRHGTGHQGIEQVLPYGFWEPAAPEHRVRAHNVEQVPSPVHIDVLNTVRSLPYAIGHALQGQPLTYKKGSPRFQP